MNNILIIVERLSSGGVAVETLKTINYLVSLNYKVKVLSFEQPSVLLVSELESMNVEILVTPESKFKLISRLLFIINLLKENSKNKNAIILAQHLYPSFIVSFFCLVRSVKIISVIHTDLCNYYRSSNWYKKIFVRILLFLIKNKNIIIVSKESIIDSINKFGKLNATYIPNAVYSGNGQNYKHVKSLGYLSKKTKIRILLVGSLVKLKRVDSALRIIKNVSERSDKSIVFQIAGDGKEKEQLKELAKKLNIDSMVEFLGHVSDISAVYNESDILLSTSEMEGLPLNLIEAIGYGMPIVANNCNTGPREIMLEGGSVNDSLTFDNNINVTNVGLLIKGDYNDYNYSVKICEHEKNIANAILFLFDTEMIFNNERQLLEYNEYSVMFKWESYLNKVLNCN